MAYFLRLIDLWANLFLCHAPHIPILSVANYIKNNYN